MNSVLGTLRVGVIAAMLALPTIAEVALAGDTAPTNDPTANESTSGYIRDYLSDPRRTGSLAGSIIGGALLANPAGPILGSVIGFFIGKNSMYDEDKTREQQSNALYARRDIVPEDGGMRTLTLAKGIDFDASAPASSRFSGQGTPELTGFLREQLVEKCAGNGVNDPRLRSLCFYLQGS